MGKDRNDYYFDNRVLKLIPLDLQQKFSREEWLNANQDKSVWEEVTIPDVSFIDFVGFGANGIVLKAKENITDRICAVKIWLPNIKSIHYSVYFDKYQEEIKKISHLNNPSIVTIYKAGITEKGYCYSFMEWVEGITLKKFLEREKYISDEVRYKILNDILLTINECHRNIVFHGDLHSENILIEENFKVKILDFGTSLLNRSSAEYNKQRESALLLETVLKLLHVENTYGLLNFKFYSSLNPKRAAIKNIDDVRNIEPIIVSNTLKNLCEMYYLVEKNYLNDEVFNDMLDFLLASTHIDIQSFMKYIDIRGNGSDSKLLMLILKNRLNYYLFEPDIQDFYSRTFELALCYYELLKKNKKLSRFQFNNQFNNFNIDNFQFEQILDLASLEDALQFIISAKRGLTESEYLFFLDKLFLVLGGKFKEEYEPSNNLKQDFDLLFKFNELKLKRNYSIGEILNWNYR
ncbi:protein kinase family protein [Psychrobacillus sp. FSL K6-1415]|uniref:protein kinase family protein n=1 Tax=Psychrobacillus sp. FSL K6-1415 TaxID=2921544 RepID=UPI0030F68B84